MKIEPTLNGIAFSEYGAKLLEYSVAAHDSTDGYFMPAMSYRPVAMSRAYQGRKISITCTDCLEPDSPRTSHGEASLPGHSCPECIRHPSRPLQSWTVPG